MIIPQTFTASICGYLKRFLALWCELPTGDLRGCEGKFPFCVVFILELDCALFSCFQNLSGTGLYHVCTGQAASSCWLVLVTLPLLSPTPPPLLSPRVPPPCTSNSGQVLSISSVGREVGMVGKERLEVMQIVQGSFRLKWNKCSQRLVRRRANRKLPFGSPQSSLAMHSDAQHCWAACGTCAHLFPRETVLKFDKGGWVRKSPNL